MGHLPSFWWSHQAARIAAALSRDVHYTVDEKQKSVMLTEDGYEAVEDVLQARTPAGVLVRALERVLWGAL